MKTFKKIKFIEKNDSHSKIGILGCDKEEEPIMALLPCQASGVGFGWDSRSRHTMSS
jgi:hypothetical protein